MRKALAVTALSCAFLAGCLAATVASPQAQALSTPAPVQYSQCTGLLLEQDWENVKAVGIPHGWSVVGGAGSQRGGLVIICA